MAKHKLDKLFSEGLASYEVTPAPAAWDQIEKELDRKSGKQVWSWLGIAASAALLLASSWFLLQEENAEEDSFAFEYSESAIADLNQPAEVVYVPIYIYSVIDKTAEPIKQPVKTPVVLQDEVLNKEESRQLAQEEIVAEQPEIIALEDVPLVTSEEVIMASTEIAAEEEPASPSDKSAQLQPVTIIYKQGEPAEVSNFTKALDYMEDVRLGEKKLVNFEKLRENFRSKFRSGAETD